MSKLPEPTIQDLKDYEVFHHSPKYVVRYKEWLMTENPKNRVKTIKHYGFFTTEQKARDHFFNLPTYYQWKKNQYARTFIKVISLEEFKKNKKRKGGK